LGVVDENGGKYHLELFLERRVTRFPVPVVVAVTVGIPVAVVVTDNFTSSRKFTAAAQGGRAEVEGRPNSTILAAEGNW
jgi:hypothetical protein